MKTKYKLLSVMLAVCLIFPAFASYVGAYSETQQCLHNTLYDFDNETMTVKGVYEGNRIEAFFADVRFYSDAEDTAVVLQNGVPVTEGVFQEGMIVQIYHGDTLYGEYRIEELLEPFSIAPPENGPMRAAAANAYGFTLPLDNMNLTSHVSAAFGSDFGGPNTGYPDHRGADFSWGGITGTPIRAIKSGTVDATNIHSSYGNHVRIDHGNGQKSLYAHMNATPLVSVGQWVTQGQIIGYVGSSGNVTGPHLHLEIQINGALVNPVTYLAGAPTYSPTHTHSYQHGSEAAHPHREYMKCACGDYYYTGETAMKLCYEADHPHREYNVCEVATCPQNRQYTGNTGVDLCYEGAHPHREYNVCEVATCPQNRQYTGNTGVDLCYEEDHPHREYNVCEVTSCPQHMSFTGTNRTLNDCAQCNPEICSHTFVQGICTSCEIQLGDVNCDGAVNDADETLLKQYCAGLIQLTDSYDQARQDPNSIYSKTAELNVDGIINAKDLLLLKKLLAGENIFV